MHLKKKNLYYYALLLIFVAFTSSISNINGWCVDKVMEAQVPKLNCQIAIQTFRFVLRTTLSI